MNRDLMILLGIGAGAFILGFLMRHSGAQAALPAGQYTNAEVWDIQWNRDGLPSKVTIHRDALRR